jgi:hypothetical protein
LVFLNQKFEANSLRRRGREFGARRREPEVRRQGIHSRCSLCHFDVLKSRFEPLDDDEERIIEVSASG